MRSTDYAKELAAKKSLDFIEDGMVVGLGTGSTATCFIEHEQGTCRIPFNPDYTFSAVSGN